MAEYNGSIELISGLVQKNKADFPLMEAHAVAVYETDAEGSVTEIRLDEKLQKIKDESTVSQEMQDTIVNNAKEAVFASEKYNKLSKTVESNSTSVLDMGKRLNEVESKIDEGDNDKLNVQFEQAESMLYLFEGESLIKPDPAQGIEGNVISYTTVTGGSGGTSLKYKLTLKVLDDSTSPTYLSSDKAFIHYRAEFIDTSVAEGEDNLVTETLNFKMTVTSPNGTSKDYNFKAKSNEDLEYNITDLLELGDNSIKLSVFYTEDVDGSPITIQSTKRWVVKIADMYLTSTYDDSVVRTNNTVITVTVFGDLNKTLHWIIDGDKDKSFKRENILLFNYDIDINIPMQSHGNHTVEVYLTSKVNGVDITSPSVNFDIMFAEENNNSPIIRAVPKTDVRQQYTVIPIEYSVYDPSDVTADIELKAMSENQVAVLGPNGEEQFDEDGELITETIITEEFKSTLTVDRTKKTWNYNPTLDGKKTLTITCKGTVRTLTFDVAKFPYVIAPVTNGLELDFNPEGRTNQDENYNEFNYNGFDWTLSDNFDWNSGGWKVDADGSTYFCIKAGTTVTFNYPLFGDENTVGTKEAKGNGKEFKLIFKTTNVADVHSTWLTCMAETEKFKPVGIQMDMHDGYVTSSLGQLKIPYSEEDVIEFDMNIIPFGSSDEKDIPMIMTYEDGTPVQPMVITDTDTSFTQETPVPITIGSQYCDVHIYRMKAYNTFLTDKQILNNFIADARTGSEKANRYIRNQIYNATTGQLTPDSLAEACPDLRVVVISAPSFTRGKVNDKWDKVKNTTVKMIYKNGRIEDNWTATNAVHTGQGTSSNGYGQAGRNIDIIMKDKDGAVITIDETKQVVKKVSLTENSIPVNYFNIKVNIASSENANNSLLQKRFDRYLPYIPGSHVHTPEAKTTMEFFNCVVFVQETGPDKVEFSDDKIHFYGIGNIGDSKKTDSSRASDPDDPKEFCVEIMDWNRALSNFPTNTIVKAALYGDTFFTDEYLAKKALYEKVNGEYVQVPSDLKFKSSQYYFELVDGKYIVAKTNKNLEIPKPEVTYTYYEYVGGDFEISKDEHIDLTKAYYIDILEYDDFSEDYTYGFRYLNDDEDPTQIENAIRVWKEFYRFVTKDLSYDDKRTDDLGTVLDDPVKVAQWKKDFSNWCIEDAAFFFYMYTLRYTMVDNRAKNTFWHYGKIATTNENGELVYATDSEGNYIYKFDFWDYDNDTALGIDNAGKLEMTYGVEDDDKDLNAGDGEDSSPTYFRAANSTFFQRIMKYFADELPTRYASYEIDKSGVFDSENLIKEFDNWQSQFPEELWRLDYERKYKRPYVNGFGINWDNALAWDTDDPRYLTDMMNGKKKYQRRQFERNQDFYMSSKFRGVKNSKDMITLRGAGDLSGTNLIIPQDATLYITPYLNMYINLSINNTGTYYYSKKHKAGETVAIPYGSDKFEFNYIYGASRIQNLGDLSPMYLQTATLGFGEKLKEVILGNSTPGYKNNNLQDLTKVITSNNKLLETLNIENIPSFTGSLPISDIPSIKTIYAKGSGITSVTFADSGLIETAYLPTTVDTLKMNNLFFFRNLHMDNYDNLLELVKVNTPNINEKVIVENAPRLNRVRLLDINWTDEEGGYGSLTSTDLLNRLLACKGVAEDGSNIEQSVLTGKVKVPAIRQTERDAYAEAWPELTVEATDSITQYVVTFNNYDGSFLGKLYVDQGSKCPDPIATGVFNTPTKPSTAEFDYTFSGWDGIDFNSVVTKHITATAKYAETRRKYSVVWYNGNIELQRTEVEYGQGAIYNGEIPVNPTNGQGNKYYLFDGWDTLTSYITANTSVRPVWISANPYEVADKITAGTAVNDLEPVEIYALINNPDFLSKSYMTDGDYVTLQLGNMPTYSDDPSEERVLAENYEFDGSKYLVFDDIQLFNEDKDFTIALDFTPGYILAGGGAHAYLSCGESSNTRGLFISQDSLNAATVNWTMNSGLSVNPSGHIPSEKKSYREICVIRHKKGDNNLYVYRNNRYSLEPVQTTALLDAGNVTSNLYGQNYPLVIGGVKLPNRFGNIPARGKINYAKIWFKDLGDDICKECCSWTYTKLNFDFCGKERYFTSNNEVTNASFICQELLDEMNPIFYTTTPPVDRINDDLSDPSKPLTGGWGITDLRTWMNSKLLLGFPLHWRQIIKESIVKSMRGGKQSDAKDYGQDKVLAIRQSIRESNGYLYLPSLAEVNSTINASNEAPYWRNELTTNLNAAPYSIFGGNDDAGNSSRIKYLDGDLNRPSAWYLRSPYYATSTLSSMNPMLYWTAVSMEGVAKDDNRVYDPTVGNNVQLVASASLGICPCFSI